MKEINYDALLDDIKNDIRLMKEIVLATSYQDQVTARVVNCISDGLTIYFITSKAYTKVKQIEKNSNIALSINNLQIKAVAEIIGHPESDHNVFFKDLCIKNIDDLDYYNKYSKYKNSTLIKVTPKLITKYVGKGSFKYLNIEEKKAYSKGII